MIRLAVIALLALGISLGLGAPSASASIWTDEDEKVYQEALAYWGVTSPPLCSSVTRSIDDLPDGIAGQATQPGWLQPCTLQIDAAVEPCGKAVVMRHEVGHLLGYGHSEYGVMAPVASIEGCWFEVIDMRPYYAMIKRKKAKCRRLDGRAAKRTCWQEVKFFKRVAEDIVTL